MSFTLGTKFNEGTDWEFTVSQETIAEAVQAEGGITETDIADYCYVGLIDARVVAMLAESTRESNNGLYPWAMDYCPAYNTNNGAHPSKVKMNVEQKEQNPVICYQRNIITYYGTIGDKSGHFLVMDMANIKKWIMDYDAYPAYQAGNVTSTVGFPGYTGACYVYNEANVARLSAYQAVGTPTENLFLMNIFATEDTLWVGFLNPTAHSKELVSNEKLSHAAFEFDFAAADTYNAYYTGFIYQGGATATQGWSNFPDAQFPDPLGNTTVFDSYLECEDSCDSIIKVSGQYGNNQNPYITNCEQGKIVKTLQGVHTVESWGGLLFKDNNVIYKPIIEGGLVTGFTSDMDIPSEWDDMTNVTGNNISPTPPAPPTPDNPWDVDPETYGWSGGEVSGMVKYYLLTAGQMGDLQAAIASNANWTIDYLNCIVSCFVVPNSGIFFDAPIPTTVKFVLDNATHWDTGVACARIQGTKYKSGGTIEIPRLTNTFYDFEPYSDYSVYIPFCGRIPIKGNLCLGREIKVTYYPDVPTCSLTAVVSCGGATIAIAKGSFGTMTPVTSNGSDRKTAAVIGDVAPIITGIGTGIAGVALGNPLIVGAGAAQALGGIMGGVKETVQSYAYSVGSTGDSSFFGAGNRCYYYANYPIIDEVVNNSMFGHSVGYLCNTVGKLSGFKGFTICANPHVTFSASSEEREEIERLLSMGVIL